jgi:hypothetical protein
LCGLVKAQESAKTETDEEVKKEIMQLEQDKIASLEKGGAAAADWIEKHYVDDLDCIGSGGGAGICTKAEMAAEHRSGERKLRIVHHDDFKVRVYGTTAIMTFRGNNVMERKGKTITGVVRTTDVYVKLNGEWRIVVHQVTPVNE